MERRFDVVLFGATGFTGRIVADYLLAHGPADLRWALAGRNRDKLEAVRSALAERHPAAKALPLEVVDASDAEGLARLAESTRVICTTVGPYARHGEPLVAACAAAGTHYCDLTGEVQFIRRMIDRHHETAAKTGARIVHCCGFDSIPSDLGCLMVGEALRAAGANPTRVKLFLGESKGGVSGGTVASMLQLVEEMKADREVRRMAARPYALDPDPRRKGPDGRDQMGVAFDRDLNMWTGPFVMASINTRVVRRSLALRGHPYGEGFRYAEVMSTGRGFGGWRRATLMAAGIGGFLAAVQLDSIRRFMSRRFLPKPGEGPSEDQREAGYFVVRLLGEGETPSGETVRRMGVVRGTKDPGYGETAKMLAESALCLAFDGDRLPDAAGDLTPATAMGPVLIERLRRAGMTFDVEPRA